VVSRPAARTQTGYFPLAGLKSVGIDAVTQVGRGRAIVEHVPQVPAATGAEDLRAHHIMRVVQLLLHRFLAGRFVKAGPAAVGVELGGRLEQQFATPGTVVRAPPFLVQVLPRVGGLCPRPTQHLIGLGRKNLPPLRVCLLHPISRLSPHRKAQQRQPESQKSPRCHKGSNCLAPRKFQGPRRLLRSIPI
jgi:hypothetical protein